MTFIPANLDEVEESKPAPIGDYELQITSCEQVVTGPNSKNPGSPQFKISIGFVSEPNVPNITHFLSIPSENDEPDKAQFKLLLMKRFLHLFGIPYDAGGIDTDKLAMDMLGCTAIAGVTLSEPDDNGNVYNRLIVPRIQSESKGRGKPPARKRA